MNSQSQQAKDIFVELIGNVPQEEWEDRLVEASGGDQELLIRVRALLRAHAEPGSFLEEPAVANQPDPTIDPTHHRKARHPDRPLQAAAADRRRRHGRGLHGRAEGAGRSAGSR